VAFSEEIAGTITQLIPEAFSEEIADTFTQTPGRAFSPEIASSFTYRYGIFPSSIASAESFGTPIVISGDPPQFLHPSSISSAESFGTPKINLLVQPSSIASAESFGTPSVHEPPSVDLLEATQRDTSLTWLVDVSMAAHNGGGGDLQVLLQFSTEGPGGPWTNCLSQPYDRRHTLGDPTVMSDVALVAPGSPHLFVWQAFLDLNDEDEGVFDIYLRLFVTNEGGESDILIGGPFTVSTEEEIWTPAPTPRRTDGIAPAGNDFLGNGLIVPFRRGSRDFVQAGGEELVRSSVREILLTRAAVGAVPGELPWRPDFGSKLWTLKHRKNDELLAEQAYVYVLEALTWEPRVETVSVEIERDPEALNELTVKVRYRVIEQNVPNNRVVLPEFVESIAL
jgi:phage baseplate assembly protein W